MEKLLTLAVPSYNMEAYLEKCIQSCICPNMSYLDIIIVNDGSKDKTSNIGHSLASKYSGIVSIIDKENGHYGSCVNAALKAARGKYFRMLDPDDWCNTDALNTLLEKMKTCDADLYITACEDLLNGTTLVQRMSIPDTVTEGYVYDAKTFDGLKEDAKWLFCSHVLTYKTEILKSINLSLQHGICYTDNEYVFYPLDRINTLVFYNLPVYQYYVGREGASTEWKGLRKFETEMWMVLKPIYEYYFAHLNDNTPAVINNQRIIIYNLTRWMYDVPFRYYFDLGKDVDSIIDEVQQYLIKDETLYEMITENYNDTSIPLYCNFCKKGNIREYTTYIRVRLLLFYIKNKIKKLLK